MKQVIVVDNSLHMSGGKLAAMVSHASMAFLTNWIRNNIDMRYIHVETKAKDFEEYKRPAEWYEMKKGARMPKDLYDNWINGSFTKIILMAENRDQLKEISRIAHENGMVKDVDYFNIIDDSTEFEGIPEWAAIGFRPMESEEIDKVTGGLPLYRDTWVTIPGDYMKQEDKINGIPIIKTNKK